MTRIVIFATPENSAEYAGTPCEAELKLIRTSDTMLCAIPLNAHGYGFPDSRRHDWRIYREAPTVVANAGCPLCPHLDSAHTVHGCLGCHMAGDREWRHQWPTMAAPTTAAEPATGDVIYETAENRLVYVDVGCSFRPTSDVAICGIKLRVHKVSNLPFPSHVWRYNRLPETASDKGSVSPTPSDAGDEREQAARPRTSAIRRLSGVLNAEIHRAFIQCHGNKFSCVGHTGLRLCTDCKELPDEVHFHNEAIV